MRKLLFFTLIAGLMLTACGRKQMPQVVAEHPPQIAELQHAVVGNSLKLTLRLTGGSDGVGYQIDRTEMDPYCKCPGFWKRYREEYPAVKNADRELTQMINLRTGKVEYVFRIRAIDGLGRLGPWSKPIQARAEAW
ncbi:MAG: hypothetical protein ACE5F3_08340 [Mariprofundaceae bacterium]